MDKPIQHCISLLTAPIYFFVRLYRLIKCLHCDAWLLKGEEVSSGGNMIVAYSGYGMQKAYIARLVFGRHFKETYFGKRWPWQLRRTFQHAKNDICLSVYEMPTLFSLFFQSKKYLCIPDWVSGESDFSLINFSKKSLRRRYEKFVKNGFTFDITDNVPEVKRLYSDICAPYTLKQYGEENVFMSYERVFKNSERVEGISIKKNDHGTVAVVLLSYSKDGVSCERIGVTMGNEEFARTGAVQALDYFVFGYLKTKGYDNMYFGSSRAFFHDGVLEYKRKWGLRITGSDNRMMLIKPSFKNNVVKSFLARNPCMVVAGKKLVGRVFVNKQGPLSGEEKKALSHYRLPGIDKIVAYHFEGSCYTEFDVSDVFYKGQE